MRNNNNVHSLFNISVKELRDGAENGYCRICGKYSPLTKDHIPPQSCGNKGRIEFYIGEKRYIMQKGFYCRTICSNCNNALLGTDADKEFKKVYDRIKSFKNSGLYLPNNILEVDVDLNKFFRCIIAHFFAVDVCKRDLSVKQVLELPIEENFISENCRNFVLGKEQNLNNVDLYYWYYPYSNIMINPFFGYTPNLFSKSKNQICGAMIKFNPIGVFIMDKKVSNISLPQRKVDFRTNKLFFDMKNFPEKEYLEHPTSNGVIVSSDKGINCEKK